MKMIIENLKVNAGKFSLECESLQLQKGEYVALLGPTGAGKTVLLETLSGFRSEFKGRITLGGKDISREPLQKREVGLVPQELLLFPNMNVYQNIVYGLRSRGLPESEITSRLAETVNMLKIEPLLKRNINNLSSGEKQLVALARAVITRPDILLLDEPLSNVDPVRKLFLEKVLGRIHRKLGGITIHVSHNFAEAVHLADRVVILINGKLCQDGSVGAVFRAPKSVEVARFLGHRNIYQIMEYGQDTVKFTGIDELVAEPEKREKICLKVKIGKSKSAKYKKFLVCSDDIFLHRRDELAPAGKLVNTYQGRVTKLENWGAFYLVTVEAGVAFECRLSRREFIRIKPELGTEVAVSFSSEYMHFFPDGFL